jgi:hypothetical protein
LPGEQVELALGGYSYLLRTPKGQVTLGERGVTSPIDLQLVILHEVGHWFGLPHAEIAGAEAAADIMSAVLGDGKPCVAAQSMIMMNNASDLRWQYRIKEGGGLRLKASKVTSPVGR